MRMVLLSMGLVLCAGRLPAEELFRPTHPDLIPRLVLNDATLTVVGTDEGSALRIAYGHDQTWPNVRFVMADLKCPTDWSQSLYLAVTMTNPAEEPLRVGLRVDSSADATRGRQAVDEIAAGATVRWLIPVTESDGIVGMRGQPPYRAGSARDRAPAHSGVPLDPTGITSFQLFMPRPVASHVLLLHKVELLPRPEGTPEPFVDRFGQYNGTEWPGKIHDEADFPVRRRQEEAYLARHGLLPDRDRFGGWADGPKREATGRFRVEKIDGRWWFVDPDGHLFWSSGITGVGPQGAATNVGRRPFCFSWLPPVGDPLAPFGDGRNEGQRYDFFKANLFRKYGPDWEATFNELSLRRLQAWGVNTVANWSAAETWARRRVPYVLPGHANVPRFEVEASKVAGLTKKKWFPDPFDPGYAPGLRACLEAWDDYRGDPWCLGIFVDNELPWTAKPPWGTGKWERLPVHALAANGGDRPIKKALVEHLQARHGTVDSLNEAWGTAFASWEALLTPIGFTAEIVKKAEPDLLALEALIAEQYFRTTRAVVKAWNPDVLYLGPRFSGAFTPEVVASAAKHCDVISFNIYEYLPDLRGADELALRHDRPVIIGEFHFGALDRGMFHTGLRQAENQADRAAKYTAYMEAAARAPWCVGAHWFQYKDQPLTGRGDGENYNIGFIDGTDNPYPEMIEAARDLHGRLYRIRHEGK